jgi:hypothetical protein
MGFLTLRFASLISTSRQACNYGCLSLHTRGSVKFKLTTNQSQVVCDLPTVAMTTWRTSPRAMTNDLRIMLMMISRFEACRGRSCAKI